MYPACGTRRFVCPPWRVTAKIPHWPMRSLLHAHTPPAAPLTPVCARHSRAPRPTAPPPHPPRRGVATAATLRGGGTVWSRRRLAQGQRLRPSCVCRRRACLFVQSSSCIVPRVCSCASAQVGRWLLLCVASNRERSVCLSYAPSRGADGGGSRERARTLARPRHAHPPPAPRAVCYMYCRAPAAPRACHRPASCPRRLPLLLGARACRWPGGHPPGSSRTRRRRPPAARAAAAPVSVLLSPP